MISELRKLILLASILLLISAFNIMISPADSLTAQNSRSLFGFLENFYNIFTQQEDLTPDAAIYKDAIETGKKTRAIVAGQNARFKKINSKMADIYFQGVKTNIEYFSKLVDEEYERCLQDLNCPMPNQKPRIILFDHGKEFKNTVGKNIEGSCFDVVNNAILIDLTYKDLNLNMKGNILPHEFTHLVNNQKCGTLQLPIAIDEGLSVIRTKDVDLWMNRFLDESYYDKKNYSSRKILSYRTNPMYLNISGKDADDFFAKTTSLTLFLKEKFNSFEQVLHFGARFKSLSNKEAVLREYGFKGFKDLDEQWYTWEEEYVRKRTGITDSEKN